MPIPDFGVDFVLPPHRGSPRKRGQMSPYPTSTVELCQRFSTSRERVEILRGFLRLRADLTLHGVTSGFQWLGGSFLEDVETTRGRPPRDLDVVTFYTPADPAFNARLASDFPRLRSRSQTKANYRVDHFAIDLSTSAAALIDSARYWFGLFTHTRGEVWKGMLRLKLDTDAEDRSAEGVLDAWAPAPSEIAVISERAGGPSRGRQIDPGLSVRPRPIRASRSRGTDELDA